MTDDDKPDATRPEQKGTSTPSISLPKGGGAIRGIGEKLAVNAATGTASTGVPIATSPGRNGFGPKLSLSYDSGSGNGPFGFGWSLDLPQITRRTDKGLPRYHDAQGTAADSDIFLLSHAEDLVPLLQSDGSRFVDTTSVPGYTIHRYRPRIEGLFARIERWTRRSDGDIHWRSITRDNVLNLYGKDSHARIADPVDPRRVFTWLMCETRDDRGNAILYDYKPEDGVGVELTRAHERNRGAADDPRRTANRYLKRVRYGNRVPLLDEAGQRPRFLTDAQIEAAGWMFELVLDYGEHDRDAPTPDDRGSWATRFDAFSTYRAAFEVRTSRLCQRSLMFHHFPGEAGIGDDSLVRSTDFRYSAPQDPAHPDAPVYSFLNAVTQVGYRRRDDGSYLKRSMPPVEYAYTQPVVQDRVQTVDAASLQNLPTGLDGTIYRWVDLHGEGIPGILTEQGGAWFYKRNVSPISDRPVAFTPVERVPIQPNLALAGGQAQFMDLASDGIPDLVVMDGPMPGFYRHDDREGWEPFRSFRSRLNRDTRDPNVKFLDVDGDGLIDVLITEDDAFVWHPSLGVEGYGPARRVRKVLDPHEERGPRLLFDDAAQSVYLADMSGDGLTDLVRIRNGEVCYWPNLGYGHFGAKVTMDQSPFFDHAEQFDQKRVRLADIDGSGTTDLIYLHREGVRLYFNQSGNGFSAPRTLRVLPRVDDLASITAVDLFGNGTACLVWSSPLPNDARRPMRFVDLMGGDKPHLLVKSVNNLGTETRVTYVSSTRFYLQDKHAGTPWITKLAFPVHVVERVETMDAISGNRFVTRYSYHHGFYDGVEREFRGFGRVDQIDTEEFAALTANGTLPPATNEDPASQVPPVLTRTWFHTGIFLGRAHVSDFFAGLLDARDAGEYYREPGLTDVEARQRLLPDTVLPPDLTLQEEREACRSLKGTMLRQEIYVLDGTAKAGTPYTVTEQNFTVVRVQPFGGNRHAVFFTHPREVITTHYERAPADPRIGHALTLDVDDFGNVRKSLAIAYGRRAPSIDPELTDADRTKQAQLHITRIDNRFTSADLQAIDHHRVPLAVEARSYELTGFTPESHFGRFSFDEWTRDDFALLLSGTVIPYEQAPDRITKQQRLIEHVRTVYRKDDLTSLSPLGEVESLALPGQSYKLALTPGLITSAFKRSRPGQPDEELLPDPAPVLEGKAADQGGYVAIDGNWWVPSGLAFYDPEADAADPASTAARELDTARQHFFLPRKMVDPFGHGSIVEYDTHDLLLARTIDTLGNTTSAVNDYRVLQPVLVTDPNRNRAAAAFDALGMMVATAVMGKDGENLGDLLEGFDADPALAVLQAFVADPHATAPSLLGKATTRFVYDLDRVQRAGQPAFAAALMRELHFHDPGGTSTRIQIGFSYSDGFGRELQKKQQAEAGDAPQRRAPQPLPGGDVSPGELVRDAQGNLIQADTPHRWVGSGRTVFNNKGKPVKQYEPFFSSTHLYETERDLTDTGVSPVLFYDPVGRVVATLQPNHTYKKIVFNAWIQASYDENDTVAAHGTQTGDPRTDPDIAGFVHAYFQGQPPTWQTWYVQRIDNQLGPAERDAARKAAAHANTPAVEHLDALGRPFLTIAHNRFSRGDITVEEGIAFRVELDIESNLREMIDADSRVVMRYDYNQLGVRIHQAGMDAGERWTLSDVANKPIRTFDSRGFARRMTYDELRRPSGLFVTQNGVERLAERTVYGEAEGDALNQRTQVHRLFDAAGVVTYGAYDFKGNLLSTRRDLLRDFQQAVDWLREPIADDGSFTSHATYDALNRAITATAPDGSVFRPTFNDARLLDRLEMNLRGAMIATPFITNIDYDAKGRRVRIAYANSALTSYEYDPLTFRLTDLQTTRSAGRDGAASLLFQSASTVQDLHYTYDPVGNITSVADAAVRTVFHSNQQIDATGRYTYDAIYRLIEARGREHIAQTAFDFEPANGNFRDFPFLGAQLDPDDLQALRNYTEQYEYDSVGNFQVLRHRSATSSWTRRYEYQESSLLETSRRNNRLTRTLVGNGLDHTEPYTYDAHGNTTSMPHLAAMAWDYKDEFQQADLRGGGTVYYVYAGSGKRTRKVIVSQNGTRRAERIYLDGFEIHREYGGNGITITLERESLHVLDGKQRVALVETQTVKDGSSVDAPEPRQRYQFDNHLSSTNVELDQDGALISYEEYHPYGTTSFQVENSAAEVSVKRYRYTGKERDEESGLSYHGTRYYACWLGRWTSADPAGLVDGPNLYRYARANPVRFNDPNGQQPPDPANFATLESFLDASPRVYTYEYLESLWEGTHGPMTPSVSRTITYTAARAEANAGASAYRALEGMVGPEVQAGHTIAARHVPLSGISEAAANAPETFMQLQSRHGQGMSVMVEGHPNPMTPHRAQELLIDAAVERAQQANGGVLTPTAHQASGAEVRWRLQGTGFDQREADLKRASGLFDEAAAIERSSAQRAAQPAVPPEAPTVPPEAPAAVSEATTVEQGVSTAVSEATTESAALLSSAGPEASLLGQIGKGITLGRVLFAVNVFFAWRSYQYGTRPNTPAPVGNGMIGGSQGEGILNAAGTLAGGAPVGTMLRQSAELGSAVHDPGKLWDAIRSGTSSPTSIGMGIYFGAFR